MFSRQKPFLIFILAVALAFSATQPVAFAQDEEVFEEEGLEEEVFEDAPSSSSSGSGSSSDSASSGKEAPSQAAETEGEEFEDGGFEDDEQPTAQDEKSTDEGGDDFTEFEQDSGIAEGEDLEPLEGDGDVVDEPLQPMEPEEPAVADPNFPDGEAPDQLVDEPAPTPEPVAPEPAPAAPVEPTYAAGSDDPDLALEAQLYDIYVNFHSQKTSNEQWDALVGGRQTESYQIQPGDTLWGISQTLFGDGNYWPKIWSLNGRITNPHLITPGFSIRFLLGDESDAPAFTITEGGETNKTETVTSVARNETTSSSGGLDVEIPPPEVRSRPVVMRLPPSLPEWTSQDRGGNYDAMGIDFGRRPILNVQDSLPLSDYITEKEPVGLGRVTEIEAGGVVASNFQYIYVNFLPGTAKAGEEYLTVKSRGYLRRANKQVPDQRGFGIEVQGQIKLIEKVSTNRDPRKNETFRALILRTVNPVTVGSLLIRDRIQMVKLSDRGSRSNVVAQLIGGNLDESRQVYGPQSFAFLNRGSNDGLAIGQVLPIRSNQRVRNPDTAVNDNVRPVGYLQIVQVEANVSTAVILKAWEEIYPGDLTGQGALLSSVEDRGRMPPAPAAPAEPGVGDELEDFGDDEAANLDPKDELKKTDEEEAFSELDETEDFSDPDDPAKPETAKAPDEENFGEEIEDELDAAEPAEETGSEEDFEGESFE